MVGIVVIIRCDQPETKIIGLKRIHGILQLCDMENSQQEARNA